MSTKDRLLAAAADLYRREGLAGLTTDALARAASTSKRSIYEHFPGRDAVVEALLLARMARLEADLEAIVDGPDPMATKLRRFAEVVAVAPADVPAGFWPELRRVAPAVSERLRTRRDGLARDTLVRLLEAGVASGDVRVDVPVPLLVSVIGVLAEHLLTVEPPPGHSPLALAEAGVALVLDGVRGGAR